ncbi:MAG: thiamine pyrophosphate-dependent enzyme [Candidatus Thermoplasmatota archaeon]|nr:thiamine pyrophosphate-dependent enzyme [Candidatus Thermoplasmatota archaeon]
MSAGGFNPNLKGLSQQEELLLPGHRLCAGCGASIVVRQVLKAVRGPTIVVNATGCLEVATTIYPYTSWAMPWIHSAFENTAATASGIVAAERAFERKGIGKKNDVIAFGGDGGTYDIGFQALSGALERYDDFLYVLYDNEAYMNTGIQRSGGTPKYAWTTTTPVGSVETGKMEYKKPIDLIVAAHDIPYVATASPAYWRDLIVKARKGIEVNGPAFLHAISTCDRGWRHDTSDTIEITKLAVETCYFPLFEVENGEFKLTGRSRAIAKRPELKKPVSEFLKLQGRFSHLLKPENAEKLEEVQRGVDDNWERIKKLCGV